VHVGGKQTDKIEANDVDLYDQRVWHKQLSPQPLTEKLRLEMGRYEATLLGSKFGFFRRGWIIAFLQQRGNVTWSNDALQMAAMIGLMISLDCLISHVGAGSNRHCFAGDFRRIFAISSVATGWNSDSISYSIANSWWRWCGCWCSNSLNFHHKVLWKKSSVVRWLKMWARGYIKFCS